MELRPLKVILAEIELVRKGKFSIKSWSAEELTADMLVVTDALTKALIKLDKWKYKNILGARKIRTYTKALEVLGLRFRTATYKLSKHD
jgi:hypothetical protein